MSIGASPPELFWSARHDLVGFKAIVFLRMPLIDQLRVGRGEVVKSGPHSVVTTEWAGAFEEDAAGDFDLPLMT
jgi:hypothetical protein